MILYTDIDPKVCAWTQELIDRHIIPDGRVRCDSILNITADELEPYSQCHFFNGISGWAQALQLAGIPASRPGLWCASLPCQPFSCAGRQLGQADERHLWPAFFDLVRQRRPDTIFGEQVDKAIGFEWLDGVQTDLESEGYTVGKTVLGAHSVGSPHIRQRLYWVAYASGQRRQQDPGGAPGHEEADGGARRDGSEQDGHHITAGHGQDGAGVTTGRMGDSDLPVSNERARGREQPVHHENDGAAVRMAESDLHGSGSEERGGSGEEKVATIGNGQDVYVAWEPGRASRCILRRADHPPRYWDEFDLIGCSDGRARRIEPGSFPLAHGLPSRMVLLRGFGNAIIPQVAAEFIRASEGARQDAAEVARIERIIAGAAVGPAVTGTHDGADRDPEHAGHEPAHPAHPTICG